MIVLVLFLFAILLIVILKKDLIMALFMAFTLGFWEFIQPHYKAAVLAETGDYTVFDSTVAFLFMMSIAMLISHIVKWKLRRRQEDGE